MYVCICQAKRASMSFPMFCYPNSFGIMYDKCMIHPGSSPTQKAIIAIIFTSFVGLGCFWRAPALAQRRLPATEERRWSVVVRQQGSPLFNGYGGYVQEDINDQVQRRQVQRPWSLQLRSLKWPLTCGILWICVENCGYMMMYMGNIYRIYP